MSQSDNNSNAIDAATASKMAAALKQAREKLREAREQRTEPIAVIGLGCKFPGATSPTDFWALLEAGQVGLGPTPADRWDADQFIGTEPKQAGKITSSQAGYVTEVDQFDAGFFGISGREAASLDPQHRLTMEVAWQTLEHAGVNPDSLRGSSAGVFLGMCSNDYLHRLCERDLDQIDAYLGTGNAHSAAVGRLSYFLNWQGPAVAVDTACSSSLSAIHQAAQSLRAGECSVALAGGVNLILTPELSINLSRAGMLSPEGLCRTFASGANGFVRGEGCGLVLLKRLSDAQSDGDRILAVLRGTAINQDGRSNGLTAPNGPSQQAVVRRALAQSQLTPDAIDYVEAHGTGTELGDPTEVGALGEVFGPQREKPLLLGSVKTNIGHLEGAAGVAGLIKTVLALHHESLPAHLHFDASVSEGPTAPSPHIDWSLPIKIPTETTPWKRSKGHVRRAGVSSFGFGGTNAHVIVEEAPLQEAAVQEEQPRWVTLSAKSPAALASLVQQTAEQLTTSDSLEAISYAANVGRASHCERLAIHASSTVELIERLQSLEDSARWQKRGTVHRPTSCGWLFGGQGGCRPGMGQSLYQAFPTFREAWDECDAIVREHWPRSLAEIAWQSPDEYLSGVDAQPVLVAWQISIARLWKSWLGMPSWVLGHSLGEYAAAVIAEAISLEDSLRLVCRRAELLDTLTERGQMLSVMAPVETVLPLLNSDVSLAANNGPRQTVVSGTELAIAKLIEQLPEKTRSQRLATSHAFHSRLLAPVMGEFTKASATVISQPPQCGWISTLTGEAIESTLPADYWAQQLRQPVEFATATANVGDSLALELSPTPVLASFAQQTVVTACSPRESESISCQAAAAELWTRGATLDYREIHPRQTMAVDLPTYPFERKRHWFTPGVRRSSGKTVHPLLGEKLDLGGDRIVYQVDLATQPWLEDHRLEQTPTLPATAYIEMALAAGKLIDNSAMWQLSDLKLRRPIQWQPGEACRVQTTLMPAQDGYRVEFAHKAGQWNTVAEAVLSPAEDVTTVVDRIDESVSLEARSAEDHYAKLAEVGLYYGPAFRLVKTIQAVEGAATAQLASADNPGFLIHPAVADAALQTIAQIIPANEQAAYIPADFDNVTIYNPQADGPFRCIAGLIDKEASSGKVRAFVSVVDSDDRSVWRAAGITLVRAPLIRRKQQGKRSHESSAVTYTDSPVQEDEVSRAVARLSDASTEEQILLLLEHVTLRLAVVMDMTAKELQPSQPLDTLGLDSLMAFELKDDLEESLGIETPLDMFLQRMTIQELAEKLAEQFEAAKAAQNETDATDADETENWIEGAL